MGPFDGYKRVVQEYCQRLAAKGYLVGTGGNVSIRIENMDAIAITPSNKDYAGLTHRDICVVNFALEQIEGDYPPSIETGLHISAYKHRLDINAVIHTHQTFARVFSLINQPIPALFDEQVFKIGNVVDIIDYSKSGSLQLTKNVKKKLANRCNCYIMRNHGALCFGISLQRAFHNVEILERIAKAYCYALLTGKKITRLPGPVVSEIFQVLMEEQEKEIIRKTENQNRTA